jgi:Zn-finger nucleic acid-binding protein
MSGGPFRTPGVREEEPAPDEEEPDAFRLQTWESSRHCPGCRSRMFAARCGGVRIDGCDGCGGAWVQAAELAKVQHRATAMAAILAGLTGAAENATATVLEGTRLCPDCAVVLAVVPMWVLAGFDGERVERCKLHGTFFDRNELASFTRAAFGDAPRNAEPITMPTRDGSPPPPEPLKPPHGVALLLDRIADKLRRALG